jgi:hypothetical protein
MPSLINRPPWRRGRNRATRRLALPTDQTGNHEAGTSPPLPFVSNLALMASLSCCRACSTGARRQGDHLVPGPAADLFASLLVGASLSTPLKSSRGVVKQRRAAYRGQLGCCAHDAAFESNE